MACQLSIRRIVATPTLLRLTAAPPALTRRCVTGGGELISEDTCAESQESLEGTLFRAGGEGSQEGTLFREQALYLFDKMRQTTLEEVCFFANLRCCLFVFLFVSSLICAVIVFLFFCLFVHFPSD